MASNCGSVKKIINIRYDEADQFKYHFGCLKEQWYNQEFIKAVSVSKVHKTCIGSIIQSFAICPISCIRLNKSWWNILKCHLHGKCHQTQNKISQISGKLLMKNCADPEKGLLRDLNERNKGLPVSQASVGGWSKCNPKYSILFLYIFQDVWSCLYSGFCLNCHVCGCHFGLQVIPALFEWRGIIIIIISQLFFIQIIINNIILINSNSEAEDNMITCSYNLTCRHTRCSLFHDSWHESSFKLFSIIFTPQKPCSDARN